MSIATKTGDSGETSLMYGRRVQKADARVEAYGSVDELNSALGVVRVSTSDAFTLEQVYSVQKELIIVMGELATAGDDLERFQKDGYQLTNSAMVDRLTEAIHHLENEKLSHFKGWAIPGSTAASAALDVARTTCRRAERRVASLHSNHNPEILRYLNRLSDLCWLLGRYAEKLEEKS
jgi:cob(I)alamin adenosyltransferase